MVSYYNYSQLMQTLETYCTCQGCTSIERDVGFQNASFTTKGSTKVEDSSKSSPDSYNLGESLYFHRFANW